MGPAELRAPHSIDTRVDRSGYRCPTLAHKGVHVFSISSASPLLDAAQ